MRQLNNGKTLDTKERANRGIAYFGKLVPSKPLRRVARMGEGRGGRDDSWGALWESIQEFPHIQQQYVRVRLWRKSARTDETRLRQQCWRKWRFPGVLRQQCWRKWQFLGGTPSTVLAEVTVSRGYSVNSVGGTQIPNKRSHFQTYYLFFPDHLYIDIVQIHACTSLRFHRLVQIR